MFIPALKTKLANNRRLLSGAFWATAGAGSARVLMMIAAVACARRLGKESYGAVGILVATMANFSAVATFGLGNTASNYVARLRARDPERLANVMALCCFGSLASGLLYLSAIALLAPWLATTLFARSSLATALAFAAISIPFAALSAVAIGILNGFELFSRTALVNTIGGILGAGTTLLALRSGTVIAAVLGLLSVFVYSSMLGGVFIAREAKQRKLHFTYAGTFRERWVLWEFSLPALLSSVTSLSIWACFTLLARQPDGYSHLGLYSAADRYRAILVFVPAAFGTTLLPVLANVKAENANHLKRDFFKALLLSGFAVAIPALCAVFFPSRLMGLFGEQFIEGGLVLSWLAIASLFEVINNIVGIFIIVNRSMWTRFYIDLLLAVVLLGSGYWLIPRHGAVGMAMAYTCAFMATSATLLFITLKDLRAQHSFHENPA